MKIVIVARKLDLEGGGGSNRSLHLIAEKLAQKHNITIITINSKQNNFAELPYKVIEYNLSRSRIKEAVGVRRVMNSHEADLFHVFNPGLLPGAGIYRKNNNTPVIGRLNTYTPICTNMSNMKNGCYLNCTSRKKLKHDENSPNAKVWKAPEYIARTYLVPNITNSIDRLFAISPAVKEIYSANGYENITVVPNFADPDFLTEFDKTQSNKKDSFSFLFVGRIQKSKGVDLLVDAALELDKPITVDIIGDGPIKKSLQKDVQSANSRTNIQFHGWMDYQKLPNFYSKSDIFIHPGRWPEPFGRTILEALQHQTPCLVSDTGGPPWIIQNSGMKFNPGDHRDLMDKMKIIIDNPDEITRLKSEIPSRLSKFTRQRIVKKINSEYARLV